MCKTKFQEQKTVDLACVSELNTHDTYIEKYFKKLLFCTNIKKSRQPIANSSMLYFILIKDTSFFL